MTGLLRCELIWEKYHIRRAGMGATIVASPRTNHCTGQMGASCGHVAAVMPVLVDCSAPPSESLADPHTYKMHEQPACMASSVLMLPNIP